MNKYYLCYEPCNLLECSENTFNSYLNYLNDKFPDYYVNRLELGSYTGIFYFKCSLLVAFCYLTN